MWAVRYFLVLVLIAVVLLFAVYNSAQHVDISIPGRLYFGVPLVVVLFCAFCVGMLASFVLTIVHWIRVNSDAKAARRRVSQLEMELTALRNRSLEDIEKLDGSEVRNK